MWRQPDQVISMTGLNAANPANVQSETETSFYRDAYIICMNVQYHVRVNG